MDRNFKPNKSRIRNRNVALRKESVDRNLGLVSMICLPLGSLSARRAWIEIVRGCFFCVKLLVALRKESVDRNMLSLSSPVAVGSSLSARRAWIEMASLILPLSGALVALRKESVDRNLVF